MLNHGNDLSWRTAKTGDELLAQHSRLLQRYVSELDLSMISTIGELLYSRCLDGNTVFCLGNGGSAATAAHLATDLFFGRRMERELRPRAISLVANVPLMTALANDVGYDDVFVEQLNGLFKAGDIVIGVSASGNSENVLRAVDFAHINGGASVGLVGFDGGVLKSRADYCVHVDTPKGYYELVEDVHNAICHMLANYLKWKAVENNISGDEN